MNMIHKQVEKTYYKHAQGVQVSIMDIPKIFSDCTVKFLAGGDMDAVVKEAIAKYRKN